MEDGEAFLMRPVLEGMIRGESLLDGSVDLEFVSLCNEALDVRAENQYRRDRAAAAQRGKNGR